MNMISGDLFSLQFFVTMILVSVTYLQLYISYWMTQITGVINRQIDIKTITQTECRMNKKHNYSPLKGLHHCQTHYLYGWGSVTFKDHYMFQTNKVVEHNLKAYRPRADNSSCFLKTYNLCIISLYFQSSFVYFDAVPPFILWHHSSMWCPSWITTLHSALSVIVKVKSTVH